ncbi:MAG: 16S rRNA (uracil(1498)-N(3))-methyltransferase [Desulfuromonadales bacterium]|nr:16S rRNA (uracil(1498)-N(3))-methyltransferase [Desulfuromonadales bacterium]
MNLILLEDGDFVAADRVVLRGRRLQHIRDVLRAETGQSLRVGRLNGSLGTAGVVSFAAEQVELRVVLDQPPPAPQPLTLLLALPRPKVLKRILQAVAGLGVKQVVLLNSWRVDKSYWQSPLLTPAALRAQLLLGLEQGRDTVLPEVLSRPRFKPFVEDELPQLLAGHTGYLADPGATVPCPAAASGPLLLAVGPEGGFIPYEVDLLTAAGLQPVHLGARALRVETAVAALLGRLLPI